MSRKKIITILLTLMLVVGVGASFFLVPGLRSWTSQFFGGLSKEGDGVADDSLVTSIEPINLSPTDRLEVGSAVASGDAAKVEQIFDSTIRNTSSDEDKAVLYVRKAESLLQLNDFDASLRAALEAEKLNENDLGAVTLAAEVYKLQGDNKKASEYYRKAAAIVAQIEELGEMAFSEEEYLRRAAELDPV